MLSPEPQRPTAGPPTRMVGRAREEAELERLVAALGRGAGGALVLIGPRGIGKSRLLAALVRRAARAGVRVEAADGADAGAAAPYGAAAALLEPLVADLPAWQLRRVGRERLALLSEILTPSPLAGPHPVRWRRHRIVRDVLALVGRARPLLLAIDDLHEADPLTVELFSFLFRRAPVPGVGLAAVVRPDAMSELLRGSAYVGARQEGLVAVVPSALAEHDVADLLGPWSTPARTRELHVASRGNPARVRWLAAGAPLAEVLAPAWADLDADAAALLGAGAALGPRFDLDVAAEVAGLDADAALAALDALAARGLVTCGARLRDVAFADADVRAALDERTPAGVQRAAAAALGRRAAPLSALAGHVARGARAGDRDAVALLVAAARAGAADAVAWLTAARRLLPAAAPADERADVLVALARALLTARCVTDARAALDAALALDDAALAPHRAELEELAVAAGVEAAAGREDGLAAAVRRFDAGDRAGARRAAQAVLAAGERPDAAACLALLDACAGELDAAAEHADVALAAWRESEDADLATRLDVVAALGTGLMLAERFADAAELLERGLAVARRTGAATAVEWLLAPLADVRRRQGALDVADAHLREGLEATRASGVTVVRLALLTIAAEVAVDRDHVDAALELGEAAAALAVVRPAGMRASAAHAARAAARLAAGRPEAAAQALPEADTAAPVLRPGLLVLRARVHLALGAVDEAHDAAQAARRWAEALGLRGARADADAARAAVALAQGDAGESVRLAVGAHRLHSAAGTPVAAARDLLIAADALAAAGETTAAEQRLREAHALAFDAGAHALRAATERALGRPGARTSVGVGPDQRSEAGAPLARRERRIALLVGQGADNAAIAAQLHLSARTVERLVATVRRKLGMPSRAALAAHVASRPEDFAA